MITYISDATLILVSFCDKNTMAISNLKKKGFILVYSFKGIEFIMAGNEWKRTEKAWRQEQMLANLMSIHI